MVYYTFNIMCGIAGILSHNTQLINQSRLQLMANALQHRGPDGEGFWVNETGTLGMAHRRLSIIDLGSSGKQPMHYQQRFTIVYNGEIYNYKELKNALQQQGFAFNTSSDTEVVLAAYSCYGKDCLQHFDGMFAFAIWDNEQHTLFAARDRFGEKPFYYHLDEEVFSFASEMKALWSAGIPRQVNNTMLLHYLTLGYTSHPSNAELTFYRDIFQLPPAHYLKIDCKQQDALKINVNPYWHLDKETKLSYTENEAAEKLLDLLSTSSRLRLRSDVAIGTSLSGGLDSSSIVAIIHGLQGEKQSYKPASFSAVFPGYTKDESAFMQDVSRQFNLDSYTVNPTADSLAEDFEKVLYHQEEPFQSLSIYAQYKVYGLAKQHGVTVLLDGQGADEILAGYHKYYHWYGQELIANGKWKKATHEMHAAQQLGTNVPWGLANYAAAFFPGLAAKQLSKKGYKTQQHFPLLQPDFIEANSEQQPLYKPVVDKLNDLLYFNTMQYGLQDLLRYADRNSMAHGCEVRLPFLSHTLVEFVFGLPGNFKINMGWTKWLLRKVMNNHLPENIVWRKDKVGFEPPQMDWMQHPFIIEQIHESRKKLVAQQIFAPQLITQPLQPTPAHAEKNIDWRILCAASFL